METRDLVRTALMAALCVAIGYAVKLAVPLPNVEMFTAAVFTCGVLAGVGRGARVGLLGAMLYFGLNPHGVSPPPVYAASVVGMTAVGAGGGALIGLLPRLPRAAQPLVAGASGFVLTLFYDLLTNLAVYLLLRESTSLAAVLLMGFSFPFPLAHPLGNMLGCALLAPAVCRRARRWSVT